MHEEKGTEGWRRFLHLTQQQKKLLLRLLLVLAAGILLMSLGGAFGQKEPEPAAPPAQEGPGEETALSARLEELLGSISGVGEVHVLIYFSSAGETEYAEKRSERREEAADGAFSSSLETELVIGGNYGPVQIKAATPLISGVLVTAEGAEDPLLREEIFRAVLSLLPVDAHQVTVCAGKGD